MVPVIMEGVLWLLRLAGTLVVLGAVLPMVRSGWWLIRGWDFPRVQFMVIGVGAIGLSSLLLFVQPSDRVEPGAWLALTALATLWQASCILPFTPVWSTTVPSAADPGRDTFRIVVANLDKDNQEKAAAREALDRLNGDVLLLIEYDQPWADALAPLRDGYDHHVETVRDKGLGMALWSRLPTQETRVAHLVTDRRPSIHATLLTPEDRPIRFVGLHPTPPGLNDDATSGRRDSRVREAELMIVGRTIADEPDHAWVVAGDLNDVAWSHTTRLFVRVSGMKDPRVGRRLLNTFHTRSVLMRYPVDHVFMSEGFEILDLQRARTPGSDHFAIYADLCLAKPQGPCPGPHDSDEREAEQLIDQGQDDAREVDDAT